MIWVIQVLRITQMEGGGGWITFSGGKRYEGVRFNVISVTRGGWVGVQFPKKKRYATLEWSHSQGQPPHSRQYQQRVPVLDPARDRVRSRLVNNGRHNARASILSLLSGTIGLSRIREM